MPFDVGPFSFHHLVFFIVVVITEHRRLLSIGLANFTCRRTFKWKWVYTNSFIHFNLHRRKKFHFFVGHFIIICYSFCVFVKLHVNQLAWIVNGLRVRVPPFAYHLNCGNESTELHRNVIILVDFYYRCTRWLNCRANGAGCDVCTILRFLSLWMGKTCYTYMAGTHRAQLMPFHFASGTYFSCVLAHLFDINLNWLLIMMQVESFSLVSCLTNEKKMHNNISSSNTNTNANRTALHGMGSDTAHFSSRCIDASLLLLLPLNTLFDFHKMISMMTMIERTNEQLTSCCGEQNSEQHCSALFMCEREKKEEKTHRHARKIEQKL